MRKIRLAIFASGGGSNAETIIIESFRSETAYSVELLVSNNSHCGAITKADMFFLPTFHISSLTHPNEEEYIRTLLAELGQKRIEMIALAGYMKHLPVNIIREFHGRILNIHPALLPKFGGQGMFGLNVHKAVLAAGETESGATVHEVKELYDTGKTVLQERVPVLAGDTPETLSARVLEVEHRIYPQALHQRALQLQ